LGRHRLAIVAIIGVTAVVLSVASFQYYSFSAAQITEIAKKDVRSNALIEVQGLSNSLENKISAITSNLQILSAARPVVEGNVAEAQALFDNAQAATRDLSEGYYWLDSDGVILTYSDLDSGRFPDYRGDSLAHRDYFTVARDQRQPYTTTLIESVDNVTRIYLSQPILQETLGSPTGSADREFHGVVVAALNPKFLGNFMKSQLSEESSSSIGLMDKGANILYSQDEAAIGTNYFDEGFQSAIPAEIRDDFNAIIMRSLGGATGAEDLSLDGQSASIAYSPVSANSEHVWTAYSVYAHNLAGEVGFLVEQQRNFSLAVIASIGGVAALIALLILSWNRRLQVAVNDKTSELQRAVGSLEEANLRLREHDRMQQEFVNVAAHELRTPIQPILGASEIINNDFNDNPGKNELVIDKEIAEMIYRNAKRLERLSSDILQVTRIEGNKLRLDKEEFDLNTKVQNVLRDVDGMLAGDKRARVNFKLDLSAGPLYVQADKAKIYEVVSNLLSNAVKFTRAAGPDRTIHITTEVSKSGAEASYAIFKIVDSGTGIDSTIMPRLFTKFATKSDQGTGLGLYISRSIIEAHGGKIWAENNAGGTGATFGFSLPLVTVQSDNNDPAPASSPDRHQPREGATPIVLRHSQGIPVEASEPKKGDT
jgi:signal transduction histidine kinase